MLMKFFHTENGCYSLMPDLWIISFWFCQSGDVKAMGLSGLVPKCDNTAPNPPYGESSQADTKRFFIIIVTKFGKLFAFSEALFSVSIHFHLVSFLT